MTDEALQIGRILAAGGFSPMTHGPQRGFLARETNGGWWLGGVFLDGQTYSKHTMISDATTFDPALAAEELVAHARSRLKIAKAPEPAQTPSHETDSAPLPESGPPDELAGVEVVDEPAAAADDGSVGEGVGEDGGALAHETDGEIVQEGCPPEIVGSGMGQAGNSAEGAESELAGEPVLRHGDEGDAPKPSDADPVDATFTEIEGADLDPGVVRYLTEEATDPLALPEPDTQDFEPDPIAEPDVAAGVAIFGDNLPLQRLLLIGAVTRHAAGLKAILQDGWTLDEFRSLQNLVVRIDRGEATDDPVARARFQAISEASRAMSAIDAHAEAQVAYLEAATREQIDGYRVEEGWPDAP